MNHIFKCIVFICFIFNPSILLSQTIKIATIDWSPYVCVSNNKYPGILVEYVKAIYANTDYKIEFREYPWSRSIKMTEAGEVDAILAPAKNEAPNLIFPETNIGTQRFCMFTLKEDLWKYTGPKSVSGRLVIYPQDALPEELSIIIHNETMFYKMPYNSTYISKSTELLLCKRYNTILMTYYAVTDYLNKNNLSDRIKSSGCVSSQKLYLAFSPNQKKQKRIKQLIEIFEKEILQLKKSNYFQKVLKKYQLDDKKS